MNDYTPPPLIPSSLTGPIFNPALRSVAPRSNPHSKNLAEHSYQSLKHVFSVNTLDVPITHHTCCRDTRVPDSDTCCDRKNANE